MFDLERIQSQTNLRHVEYHETLESTNKLAADLAAPLQDLCPALVLTRHQTAGRGRGSNVWKSPVGALTFSVVYRRDALNLPPERLPQVSLSAGLAVRTVIAELTMEPCLVKWPNDVLLKDRKICGILTEQHHVSCGDVIVVGIGVNVNNSVSASDSDFRTAATSIYDVKGESCDLSDVLIAILQQLDECIRLLARRPRDFFGRLNRFSQLNGRSIIVDCGVESHAGLCIGIDDDGRLLLEINGQHKRLVAGSVVSWSEGNNP